MEQTQTYSIKIHTETHEIVSMGLTDRLLEEPGTVIYPVSWKLIEPFFNQTKHHRKYQPVVADGVVKKFKLKEEFESEIVTNIDEPIVKALRSYENFIVQCKIQVEKKPNKIVLTYKKELFNEFDHEENLDHLNTVRDRVYNMYITRRGDPFVILSDYKTTFNNLIDGKTIEIPYDGEQEISVYAIA